MEETAREESKQPYIEVEGMSEEQAQQTAELMQRFVTAYAHKDPSDTENQWLKQQLHLELPEKTEAQIQAVVDEIISSVKEYDNNLQDLHAACDSGMSKESWFAKKAAEAAEGVSMAQFGSYLDGINQTLAHANAQMIRTATTHAGTVSQCINLDGFLAEQHAVNTFNMKAKLNGSPYFAEVKVPGAGETYGLNSFDTVIKDRATGKIVHQYQFKFGKDAKSTIAMLKDGNYNNQRFVVPAEQVEAVRKAFPGKSVDACMGGTDKVKICSDPLTKADVKQMQLDAQEGGIIPAHDWNVYNTKEVAMNIGKHASLLGLEAALITTGFQLAEKTASGHSIQAEEVIETALRTGADTGIKEAVTGALKVGTEKGIITIIPKGTGITTLSTIACVGIENTKILIKVSKGELDLTQGMDYMGRNTVAMALGLSFSSSLWVGGAAVFSWIPFVGPVLGGIAGGLVGYMAGSEIGNAVYSGIKKIGGAVKSAAQTAWHGIKSAGSKVYSGVKRTVGRIFGRR